MDYSKIIDKETEKDALFNFPLVLKDKYNLNTNNEKINPDELYDMFSKILSFPVYNFQKDLRICKIYKPNIFHYNLFNKMKKSGLFPIENYFYKNEFLYIVLTSLVEDKDRISLINLKRSYLNIIKFFSKEGYYFKGYNRKNNLKIINRMVTFSNFNNIYKKKDENDICVINMIYELLDVMRLYGYDIQSSQLQEKLNSTLKIMSIRYSDSYSRKTKYIIETENVLNSLF